MSETKTVRLGDIATIERKSVQPSMTDDGTFYLGLEHIQKGGRIIDRSTVGESQVKSSKFQFTDNHILYGKLRPYLAKIASPAFSGVCSTDILPIKPGPAVDKDYLFYYLRQPHMVALANKETTGANLPRISPKALAALPVELPSIEHQKKLAEQYRLQDLIKQKREHQQELYAELERSLFISIFGNPETWANNFEMTIIGDLAESTQYGTSAKAGATGEYPVLRMGNITDDGKLDLSDLKYMDLSPEEVEKYTVRKGDLLFNRTNSKEKVGKAAVVLTDEKLAYAGYLVRVRFKNPDHAHFVAAFLNSDYGRKLRRKLAKTAVNQANINAKELTKIPIIEPENAKIINFNNFFTL
ncbi:restriction endonuclease subunit S [Rothia nasimurium]|uniref:restriction endonuclease subunit S n=1 Tax=Rothia nasimurium TaxID=85336 RepID=UPI001F00EFDB|nr:restriction endonuclease subunit S [Rothia nasimurium]